MLDQSFSLKSFQEIFDQENRKGINVEEKFKEDFKESLEMINKVKILRRKIKEERDFDERKRLYDERKTLKNERGQKISEVLDSVANKIGNHKIKLELGGDYGGQSYRFEKNILNYFISKKVQSNICQIYNVKQSSRYAILSELLTVLEDDFPKYVIRTDIKSFYESIPQKKLLDKVNSDYLLSINSKKFINQVFKSYNELTNQSNIDEAKGVPRGIGISAYLAELYMRSIDNKIKELESLVYYARYVDDIIAVFIPFSANIEVLENYKDKIESIITAEGGDLVLNSDKTKEFNLLKGLRLIEFKEDALQSKTIDYLGYEIGSNQNKKDQILRVRLSKNKMDKYFKKIKLSFQCFNKKKKHNRHYEFKLLSARINYLTSNTKLRNNKDKVYVGIFYSNPFLNCNISLEKLQKRLKWYIKRGGFTSKEKEIMMNYSFINGFDNKTFQILPLMSKKYKSINKRRGDKNNKNNKGILKFGIVEINSIWRK